MNKLLFPNGGVPLYGDDFNYMQESLREGITASLRPYAVLTGGKMIVFGCDMSLSPLTGTLHFTAGVVMIDYQLYSFVGGDSGYDTDADIIEVEAHIYDDPNLNATRTLANGNAANIWQKREARFKQITTNTNTLFIGRNENRLAYLVAKLIEGAADVDVILTQFLNNWGGGNLISPKATRRGNTVILTGLLAVGTIVAISLTKVFSLQENFRPKIRQYFVCAMPNSAIALVDILPNGDFFVKYLLENPQDPPVLLDISNIRFEGA
jgi:hypothetical protein